MKLDDDQLVRGVSEATCETCRHYMGLGDWDLCCALIHGLCSEETPACQFYDKRMEDTASDS